MGSLIFPILSLLVGTGLLLIGVGLLFTVLGLRAGLENFHVVATGLLMSAYFGGFIVGTHVCPALIRRVGHIRAFAALASIASAMPILHALFVDPWWWGLLRLATGFCLVGLYIVIESWLSTLAPNAQRGRLFAIYMMVTLGAMSLGQFLILAGDRLGFTPFALVSVLLSLALVPITLTRVAEPPPVDVPRLDLRKLYRLSPLGVAGSIGSGMLTAAFFGMGAVFAQRMALSDAGIAAFMSATILGGALLQWPIGYLSDRRDRRVILISACWGGALLAVLGFALAGVSEAALIAVAFLYGGLSFAIYGLSVAHVNDMIEPGRALETTGGLLLLNGIGAVIGPAAAGALMNALGPGSMMLFLAAILVALAIFGMHRMRAHPAAPADKHDFVPMSDSSPAVLRMDPRTPAEPDEATRAS